MRKKIQIDKKIVYEDDLEGTSYTHYVKNPLVFIMYSDSQAAPQPTYSINIRVNYKDV